MDSLRSCPNIDPTKQKPQESNELLPCKQIKKRFVCGCDDVVVSKFNGRKWRKVPNTAVCNKLGLLIPKVEAENNSPQKLFSS
jgi:hypothetical protein